MNTSFLEKYILGVAMQFPEYIPAIRNNEDGLFHDASCLNVWDAMSDLNLRGDPATMPILAGMLVPDKVSSKWFFDSTDGLHFVTPNRAEKAIYDSIQAIKNQRKSEKLSELLKKGDLSETGKREFDEAIEMADLKRDNFENGGFDIVVDEYIVSKETKPSNVTTGFPSIDRLTDHFHKGELIAIMGRTTTGKTFVALNILDNLVGREVGNMGFFSMEMSKSTIGERIAQLHFGCSRQDLVFKRMRGEIDFNELRNKYNGVKMYDKVYSVDEVSRIVERDGLGVIFVDYLQLMKSDEGTSLYEKTTYKMHSLKALAKNKGCTIFFLVQLSRRGEGGWEPVSIDMARDSGAIEENADFILGLWNPGLKEGYVEKHGSRVYMKLLKNKRGPVVTIECVFNPATGKIYEAEEGL